MGLRCPLANERKRNQGHNLCSGRHHLGRRDRHVGRQPCAPTTNLTRSTSVRPRPPKAFAANATSGGTVLSPATRAQRLWTHPVLPQLNGSHSDQRPHPGHLLYPRHLLHHRRHRRNLLFYRRHRLHRFRRHNLLCCRRHRLHRCRRRRRRRRHRRRCRYRRRPRPSSRRKLA